MSGVRLSLMDDGSVVLDLESDEGAEAAVWALTHDAELVEAFREAKGRRLFGDRFLCG